MAKPRIKTSKAETLAWMRESKDVEQLLESIGRKVLSKATATASDAENGSGGEIDGYAAAGFTMEYDRRSKRPILKIISNAAPAIALAAHFNSQRKNGIGHLRAALYAFSSMVKVQKYPKGKPYSSQFGQPNSNSKK